MKGRYSNGDYSYRCPFRKLCQIIIRVSEDEINNKYDKNEKMEFTIVSTQKTHSCNNDKNLINEGKLNTLENNENLAVALIKNNLTKPLNFHLDLIYKAKIPLKKRKLKEYYKD